MNQHHKYNYKEYEKEKKENDDVDDIVKEKKIKKKLLYEFLGYLENNLTYFDDCLSNKKYIPYESPDWTKDIGMKLSKLIKFLKATHNNTAQECDEKGNFISNNSCAV